MYQFLESICYDGSDFPLLNYHQDRVDRVFKEIYNDNRSLQLKEILPERLTEGVTFKIRILYNARDHQVEVVPYLRKPIANLQLIIADHINYEYKYADRKGLEKLFKQRRNTDDVLIVRDDLLTDTSYANIALFKNNHWYTPATPLLHGVRRAKLIEDCKIKPAVIRLEDLHQFEQLSLFNAMIDLGEVVVAMDQVLK